MRPLLQGIFICILQAVAAAVLPALSFVWVSASAKITSTAVGVLMHLR